MLETVSLIVGVASSILSSVGYIKNVQSEKKIAVSELFHAIADTLDTAVEQFKKDEVPHGACESIRQYAEQLPTILCDVFPEEKVNQYSNDLYQAHNVESLLMVVKTNPDSILQLEKAASSFRVAANVIKLTR